MFVYSALINDAVKQSPIVPKKPLIDMLYTQRPLIGLQSALNCLIDMLFPDYHNCPWPHRATAVETAVEIIYTKWFIQYAFKVSMLIYTWLSTVHSVLDFHPGGRRSNLNAGLDFFFSFFLSLNVLTFWLYMSDFSIQVNSLDFKIVSFYINLTYYFSILYLFEFNY